MRKWFLILLSFISFEASAFDDPDSIYQVSDAVVIGIVRSNTFFAPDIFTYQCEFSMQIIGVGNGGRTQFGDSLLPHLRETLSGLHYWVYDSSHLMRIGDTSLFMLQRTGPPREFQLTTNRSFYSPELKIRTDFNTQIIGNDGRVHTCVVTKQRKWTRTTELVDDSVLVSITDVKRKWRKAPHRTITRTRQYGANGKKINHTRVRLKAYGIGSYTYTWTFRKNGKVRLRFERDHNPYSW